MSIGRPRGSGLLRKIAVGKTNHLPQGRDPNRPQPNPSTVDYLADLRNATINELKRLAEMTENLHLPPPTDNQITAGFITLNSSMFIAKGTPLSMSVKKYIVKHGKKVKGVQHFLLTQKGLDAISINKT